MQKYSDFSNLIFCSIKSNHLDSQLCKGVPNIIQNDIKTNLPFKELTLLLLLSHICASYSDLYSIDLMFWILKASLLVQLCILLLYHFNSLATVSR